MMTLFKTYRDSIIIKDHIRSRHIIAGRHSYYSGYYHRHSFDDCVMYLDSLDDTIPEDQLDRLIIGNFCSIATGVQFMMCGTQGHNYNWIAAHPLHGFDDTFFPGHQWKGDTVIGNDVWIGAGSLIMPGIHIHDGAVVGARSVVTKNIGPYEIWAGNPAQLIKKRFSEEEIQMLLNIKWWDMTDDNIKKILSFLRSSDVKGLWNAIKAN